MFNTMSPKVRKQIFGLLTNRWAIGCLVAFTLQQLLEASSSVWLIKAMEKIASGEPFFYYLSLYFLVMAFYYVPNGIASILKITWRQEAQRSFVHAFVASNKDNVGEWSNKGIKEQKLSILTSEGPAAIAALIDYLWDLVGYVLSMTFNIMALSIFLEPLFAVAYSFSLVCVAVLMKLNARIQRKLTQKALTARVDLCQSLLASWDNVLLGNDYNFKLWQDKTEQRLDRCLQRNVALERFDQYMAIYVSLITSIPTLLVIIYNIIQHSHDPVKLSAFVVILPVLFNILSYTYQTLSLIFRWRMHRSKLAAIYKTIQASKESTDALQKKVKWQKITVTPNLFNEDSAAPNHCISLAEPIRSHADLLQHTDLAGRLTVRGENGCGKSTTLLLIKNALGEKAFFLPTHTQLSFQSEANKYSTGESLKKRLVEILEKVEAKVLLLDEWDANLDCENKEILSNLINKLAKDKCVIEVRHR